MKNQVQLITYVDRFSGGNLKDLKALIDGHFKDLFAGIHVLPFFQPFDGSDAGFDPIDHSIVDPRLGTWKDIKSLSQSADVMADLIVNHISSESAQFKDYLKRGTQSPYAGMFLTVEDVFPQGITEQELLTIYRPRPGLPFTIRTLQDGTKRVFWTTFTPQQMDINIKDPKGEEYIRNILCTFQAQGIKMIRMDAIGYAVKTPGTSCFMTGESYEFIAKLSNFAKSLGMEVLVEVHAYYKRQIEIAERVDWVYDFALPPLILQAIYEGTGKNLKAWLEISPRNAITVLDTHDGIGVIDIGRAGNEPGLITDEEVLKLVDKIHENSGGQSKLATGAAASNLDLYQVNCTYYNALGKHDRRYLLARLIQFFAPGIPQVYYAGLLAAENDITLLEQTHEGRDINRPYYTPGKVRQALGQPVVQDLMQLIRFRNHHPAFQGSFTMEGSHDHTLKLRWDHSTHWTQLDINFQTGQYQVSWSDGESPGKVDNGVPKLKTRQADT